MPTDTDHFYDSLKAVTLALLIVVSSISFASVPTAGNHTGSLSDDQTFEATNKVDVWEGAPFPLRATFNNAAWTTSLPDFRLKDEQNRESSLSVRLERGPFSVGEKITMDFDDFRAISGDLSNEHVVVVAAHIEENVDSANVPSTFSDALDLLTTENANENASFELVDRTKLDSNGKATFTHTVSQSGHYVFFVATNETGHEGFQVSNNGNLSIDGNVLLVGAETVMVHQKQSKVDPSSRPVVRGKNITFSAKTDIESDTVRHVIVLYNESRLFDQSFTVNLTKEPSKDLDLENDSKLEHSVDAVNGVGRLDGDISVLGVNLSDDEVSRAVGVATVIDFIANETTGPRPENVSTDDVVLDASVTAVEGGPDETVKIGTFSNWTTGTYKWVHIAVGNDSTKLETDTGEVGIVSPPEFTFSDLSVPSAITAGNAATISAKVENTGGAKDTVSVSLVIDGSKVDTQTVTLAAGESTTVEFTRTFATAGNFDVKIESTSSQTLTVQQPATFEVSNLDVPSESFVNDTVTATATVENTGDLAGTFNATFEVDGEVVDFQTVDLDGGESTTVEFTRTFDTNKTFDVSIAGQSSTLTVKRPATLSITGLSLSSQSVTVGDSLTVTVDVKNGGDIAGGTDVTLVVNNENRSTKSSGSIDPGESATITFTLQFDTPNTDQDIRVFGTTFQKTVSVSKESVDLTISASPTEIETGEDITFTVTRPDGTRVENAVVGVAGKLGTTDSNGQVSFTFQSSGTFTATARKPQTTEETFVEDTTTVTVNAPASIDVVDVSPLQTRTFTGDTITIEALVENSGDLEGTETISFNFDGTSATKTVTLDGGESTVLVFNATVSTTGDKTATVGGVTSPVVTVDPAVVVVGFTVNPQTVTAGETVRVDAIVENRGTTDESIDLTLTRDGNTINRTSVTVAPGVRKSIPFTPPALGTAGTVDFSVNGLPTKSVTVNRKTVELSISATPSSTTPGETVTFTVTRADGTPVSGATISVGGQTLTTGSNGKASTSFPNTGTFTARATKSQTPTSTFITDSVSVAINQPASLTVTDAFLGTTRSFVGDSVTVEAIVENTGGVSGTDTIALTDSDGTRLATKSVTLPAGGTTFVTLSTPFGTTGTRTLSVEGVNAGSVTVDPQSAVTDFTLSSTAVQPGTDITVTATVENRGQTEDSDGKAVSLSVEGQPDQTKTTGSIPAGGTAQVSFTVSFGQTGDFDVSVADLASQTVTVDPNVVDLSLSADKTTFRTTESVQFTVTRADNGNRVDATISVGGQTLQTGSDGRVTTTIQQGGTFRAVASKGATATETFNSDSVQLTVNKPASVRITGAFREQTQAFTDDDVTVSVDVTNTGDLTATDRTIELTNAAGDVLASTTVDVPGGTTKTVTLTTTFDTEGTRTLSVNGVTAGQVDIDPKAAVTKFSLSSTAITTGNEVTVTATVENRGSTDANDVSVGLNVDGSQTASKTVDLAKSGDSGDKKTVTFTPTLDSIGARSISVNGLSPKTVIVSRKVVGLSVSVSASPSPATTQSDVTFTVTSGSGNPVEDAEIAVGTQTLTTESDGTATTSFSSTGIFTAQVSKDPTATTSFNPTSAVVTINEQADVSIVGADVKTAEPIFTGDSVEVTVDLANVGGVAGDKTITLEDGSGNPLASKTVTVPAGSVKTATISTTFDSSGTRTLVVDGSTAGTVTVDPATVVTSFALLPSAVKVDERLLVEATVENRGTTRESIDVDFNVEGTTQNTKTVSVSGGSSKTVQFETSFATSGTRDISINDLDAKQVSVARDTVSLTLSANRTNVVAGESIQFEVTRSDGGSAAATITLGDQRRFTGADGTVTTSIRAAGSYTATATKAGTAATAFASDTLGVTVTDPLSVTQSVGYGAVSASPVAGSAARPNAATASKTVTITNNGGRAISLSSPRITGENASQFALGSTFPSRIPAESSKDVTVEFAPKERGPMNATLEFSADTPNDPVRSVNLSGTGEAPEVNVVDRSTVLQFGSQAVDAPASTKTVTIENKGNRTLSISAAPMGAGFSRTPNSLTISPGSSKTIDVTFNPDEPQNYGAPLTLTTNDPFRETVTVRATGKGLKGEILVSPDPAGSTPDFNFGEVTQNTTKSALVFVANTGTEAITVTPTITNDDEFSVTDEGNDVTLVPGESQFLTVDVTPLSSNPTAALTLSTGAGVDDPVVDFAATGLTPEASVTPAPSGSGIDYGDVAVGGSSSEQIVIENTGDATLEVDRANAIPASDPFQIVGATDTLTVPPNGKRTIPVAFRPTAPGSKTSTVTLTTNDLDDGEQTITIDLSGTGRATELTGDTSTLDYGTIGKGAAATKTVTLTNGGNERISNLRIRRKTGDGASHYTVDTATLPNSLGPGGTTDVAIRFEPTATGVQPASVTFAGEGETTGTNTFAVSLTGEATPADVSVNTGTLRFGFVNQQGTTSSTASVQVGNDGRQGTTLTIEDVSISGADASDYSVIGSPAGTQISGNAFSSIRLEFDPTGTGERTATLSIDTDDPDENTKEVTLIGTGGAPNASTDRSAIDFGEIRTGTTSGSTTVEISNDGGVILALDGLTLGSDEFTITDGLDQDTLVPGQTETVAVAATPSDASTKQATLTIETNDTEGDPTVALSAKGVSPALTVTDDLDGDFGDTRVGSSSRATLEVENTGDATLVLEEPTISGSNAFSVVSGDKRIRLSGGQTATYAVAFAPTADQNGISGTLEIASNDRDISRGLSGDGIAADATLSPSAIGLGDVQIGQSASTQVTLSNNADDASLNVTSVSVVGTDAVAFSVSGLPTTSIGPGGSETFTVSASPSVTRSVSAQLEIGTETQGTLSASLGATGVTADITLSRTSVTFNRTRLGKVDTETILFENTGNAPLNVSDLRLIGDRPGQFEVGQSSLTLSAQGSRRVELRFKPPTSDVEAAKNGTARSATLLVQSNDTDESTVTVGLRGTGKTPALTVPDAVQFGSTSIGDTSRQTITISNDVNGSASITLEDIRLVEPLPSEFSVTEPGTTTLQPGESTTVTASLTPQTPGSKFASLIILTNDPRQRAKSVFLSNERTIIIVGFGSVDLDYRNVDPGLQPKRTFDQGLSSDAALVAVQTAVQKSGDFSLSIDGKPTAFGDTAAQSDKFEVVRYLSASKTNLTPSQFTNATLEFRVSKAALDELGTPRDGVALYRYTGTDYEAVSSGTEFVREERTDYVYSATVKNFSKFAIAAGQPDISLTGTALDPSTITEGESSKVTATVENTGQVSGSIDLSVTINGTTVNTTTAVVDAGESKDVEFSVSPANNGTFEIRVNNQFPQTLTVEKKPAPTQPGDGQEGEAPAPAQTPAPQPTAEVTQPASDRASATVENVQANTPVSIDIPQLTAPDEQPDQVAADLEQLTITPTTSESFSVDVTSSPDPPEGTPGVETTRRANALRYFEVTARDTGPAQDELAEDQISETTFRFRVRKSTLASRNQRPENVAMFRFNNGQWTDLPTDQVDETGTHYVFEATTSGFSVFAVGVQQPDIALTGASLDRTTIDAGESVTIRATLENTGEGSGTFTVNLTVDGSVVDTKQVEVPAGETVEVTFSRVFGRTGTFDIAVDAATAGTLTVEETVTPTTTAPPPTTPPPTTAPPTTTTPGTPIEGPPEETPPETLPGTPLKPLEEVGGFQIIGMVLIVLIVVALLLTSFYRRREME